MTFVKRLLHRMQRSAICGEALDRCHLVALRLHGEQQAGTHGRPVEQHRAAPAHAVLAPDVGAGQAQVVAKVV